MPLRNDIKRRLFERESGLRVLTGPARGLLVSGPESLRVYAGLYEVELNKWIRQLVRPHDRVFDIGAQYGYDALLFSQLTDGSVLSVDTDPKCIAIIAGNVARNALDERISVRRVCVGDGTHGTMTLDWLAAETFLPDFIKMDIEGAETGAISGAEKVLEGGHSWLIEVHSRQAERACILSLALNNYDLDIVNPRRWLPDLRPIPHNRWLIASR